MKDDLVRPLGLHPGRKWYEQRLPLAAAGVVAVALLGAAAWYLTPPSARGPTVTAAIDVAPAKPAPAAPETTASTKAAEPTPALTEIEPTGGLTELNGDVVIHDPSADPEVRLAALPEADLVEKTDQGLLPRVAPNGLRPLDAYSRPGISNPSDTRVAIVLGGVGIDPDGTHRAIADLPGTITLAFAPYGDGLAAETAAARAAGHELLLQVPLEPYNYPQTNPGTNTLTASGTAEENLTRLHWFMGRITNYVGIVNYMGARFTADIGPLAPVMREIGQRGLMYLDDGSSQRSRAAEVAGSTTPFVRADMVLDADLSAEAIDDRLNQLRAVAHERGYAVATATAFPITIDRLTAFVRTAADKGITLVPVSAIAEGRQ